MQFSPVLLEIISKYIRDGDSVYSCFYDLASAFDTVEYPVLLDSLAKSGIRGKSLNSGILASPFK